MKNIRSLWSYIQQDAAWLTVSNFFSMLRILLAPVVAVGIYYEQWVLTFLIFLIAALTDALDGYFARRWSEHTCLGRVLDPLADKIFLLTVFTALSCLSSPSFSIPWWFVAIILVREVIIITGSCLLVCRHENSQIKPVFLGKLTTFSHMVFIGWLFCCAFLGWMPEKTSVVALTVMIIFSLGALFQYARYFFKNI
jgi:CDP-diacylglycerol--glycerol-3-phosphate 3-phosphatidyltransferase